MRLKSLKYTQYQGQPIEWILEECTFGDINLMVGKNASGKSRILNVIKGLGNLLSRHQKLQYRSGDYKVNFEKDGKKITYRLRYEDRKVIEEELLVDGYSFMSRGPDGSGKIYSAEFQKEMKFQAQLDEVAALTKRDSIQHPFLDDLYNWANNLIHFYFGTPLGKDTFISFVKTGEREHQLDLQETDKVVAIFKTGEERFGEKYISAIKDDMASIGYDIERIELGTPISVHFPGLPARPSCLIVKEADLQGYTDQVDMSQGMFRALSLIVQINYAQMASVPSCLLIDDIGEGLDYERSTNLIKMLVKKAENGPIQLIMATNDRFVMNNVPLRYWSIVHRLANKAVCFDYRNSPKIFDEFESTGLNNFDLFSSKYFLKKLDTND